MMASSANARITGQDAEIIDYLHRICRRAGDAGYDWRSSQPLQQLRHHPRPAGGSLAEYSVQDELRRLGVLGNKHIPQRLFNQLRRNTACACWPASLIRMATSTR
ncbi:MAG: hypothetical protein WKG07_33210 [Hymenobacter sp.]